jgi:hypothetical protein
MLLRLSDLPVQHAGRATTPQAAPAAESGLALLAAGTSLRFLHACQPGMCDHRRAKPGSCPGTRPVPGFMTCSLPFIIPSPQYDYYAGSLRV